MGTPARASGRRIEYGVNVPTLVGNIIFSIEFKNVEINVYKDGYDCQIMYITPKGIVTTMQRGSKELDRVGIKGIEVEHMIKDTEDYPIVEYIIEHTDFIPTSIALSV